MHFASPERNISLLHITDGARVADFGAGSGHYVIALAHKVGRGGRVYAIEVQKDLLSRLKSEAMSKRLTNIEYIVSDLERVGGSRLAPKSLDAVVISNILFQSENKLALITEAHRVLKPGGQLLLIDWLESFRNMGPHTAKVVSPDAAQALAEESGFIFERRVPAGSHHYGLIFHV